VLWAAALLRMPASEVRYLAQLQVILSEPVGRLLEQMPFLIRRLTTTTRTEGRNQRRPDPRRHPLERDLRDAGCDGSPAGLRHSSRPSRLRHAENHVLAFALYAIAEFGRRTGWNKSPTPGPAQEVAGRVATATKWRQARTLIDLPVQPPPQTTLARVRASRNRQRYQAALDVVELYQRCGSWRRSR
jgi:hypothetical protein